MYYIDENLCTGCGVCIGACNRGAISMRGNTAFIDENLCTSCGRCADACLTGAIIMEPVTPTARVEKPGLPVRVSNVAPPLTAATARNQQVDAVPVSTPASQSKLDAAQRFFSGLLSLMGFALDVKRSFAPNITSADSRNEVAGPGLGGGSPRGMGRGGGGRAQHKGQGGRPRGGQGAGAGRGGGGGRGRGDGSGARGRYRAI